jgi:hypothetical protein
MPQGVGALVLTVAVVNGWLASRQGRSAGRWAVASLLLAPVAWIATAYLILREPTVTSRTDRVWPFWSWLKLGSVAMGAVVALAALLNALGGLPPGGAAT